MRFVAKQIIIIVSTVTCLVACNNHSANWETLNSIETYIEQNPDSALAKLKQMSKDDLSGDEELAKYALLFSMALDKNYIDKTDFDVLQPALDYYLKHGNPDEKLKTYYYQGRIFQNRGNRDQALKSFEKALNKIEACSDSTLIVRTLAAQAYICYELYDFKGYLKNNLTAAKISKEIHNKNYEFQRLLNALNGAMLLDDKKTIDSIFSICNNFDRITTKQKQSLLGYELLYKTKFDSLQNLKEWIENNANNFCFDLNGTLNLALAYNKIGDNNSAKNILDSVAKNGFLYDTLKHQSILVPVLKDLGDYKAALSTYEGFTKQVDSLNAMVFAHKSKSIIEKHRIELQAQKDAETKSKIIWSCVISIIILLMGLFILLLFLRSHKSQKELALQIARNSKLENERLKSAKAKLALENKNLQLERDKSALEIENLAHRIDILENESECLKKLLDEPNEIPVEVQTAIKIRIEMLNSLLASHITNNYQYENSYDNWVKELTNNIDEFMNSNRLAFKASHPQFIQYFENHGLDNNEINYICLYAIGLKGKEVGNYIRKPSHVNLSSAIRKKLGIDKHETNIGIYVRRLLKSL